MLKFRFCRRIVGDQFHCLNRPGRKYTANKSLVNLGIQAKVNNSKFKSHAYGKKLIIEK